MTPAFVAELLHARVQDRELVRRAAREHEAPREIGQGRSNASSAQALCLGPKAVETHVAGTSAALHIPAGTGANRRVLAVLAWSLAQPI